jgi:TP901 family phage tail tape measure protein
MKGMQTSVRQTQATTSASTGQMNAAWKLAGLAVAGFAAKSIDEFLKFESSLTKIVTLVGISRGEVEEMGQSLLEMTSRTATGANELASALYFVTSAGIKGNQALQVTEASAKAAALGLGETEVVADAVTSAMNAYGSSNLSASHAVDVLIGTVREGKSEADAIASSLGRAIAPAETLGVSFDELGGFIAALTRVGLSADQAVTGFVATTKLLIKPTAGAVDLLDQMGISMDDLRKSVDERGLFDTLLSLRDALGEDKEAMGKLFPNQRALNSFLILTGKNAKANGKVMESLANSMGLLEDGYDEFAQTTEGKVKQAMADFSNVMIEVGAALAPLVAFLADLVSALRPVLPAIMLAVGGLVALKFAMALQGPFQLFIGFLGQMVMAAKVAGAEMLTTGSSINGLKAGLNSLNPGILTAAKSLGNLALVGGATYALFKLIGGIMGDMDMDFQAMSESTGIAADHLKVMRDQIDLSGMAFERASLSGFWASLDGVSDQMDTLTQNIGPAITELNQFGGNARVQASLFNSYGAELDGSGESIQAFSDYVTTASNDIVTWTKSLQKGSIDVEWFAGLVSRYGISHKQALRMADRALDQYGKKVTKTGKVVRQFAGMSENEFKEWSAQTSGSIRDSMFSVGGFQRKWQMTANTLATTMQQMREKTNQFASDISKLQAEKWIPDDFKKWLIDQGPDAVHAFEQANRNAKEKMVGDYEAIDGKLKKVDGTIQSFGQKLRNLENTNHVIDITVAWHESGHAPNPRLDGLVPGHTGGSVSRTRFRKFHGGGLASNEIPAILQAGEFVMRKEAVQRLGVGWLNTLNKTAGKDQWGTMKQFLRHAKSGLGGYQDEMVAMMRNKIKAAEKWGAQQDFTKAEQKAFDKKMEGMNKQLDYFKHFASNWTRAFTRELFTPGESKKQRSLIAQYIAAIRQETTKKEAMDAKRKLLSAVHAFEYANHPFTRASQGLSFVIRPDRRRFNRDLEYDHLTRGF